MTQLQKIMNVKKNSYKDEFSLDGQMIPLGGQCPLDTPLLTKRKHLSRERDITHGLRNSSNLV